jgi:hypothetical protein
MSSAAKRAHEGESAPVVLISASMYASVDDPRFGFATRTCAACASLALHFVICDDSPQQRVRDRLNELGKGYVHAFKMSGPGKKGQALRDALSRALELFPHAKAVAFFEMEKADFVRHAEDCCAPIVKGTHDLVTPSRARDLFQSTYALEQFHSESFGNAYINLEWRKAQKRAPDLDWLFGPICFSAQYAHYYTRCEAEIWDAQIIPAIEAFRDGARWTSVTVAYAHMQKHDEEGSTDMCGKRLLQVNFMTDKLFRCFRLLLAPDARRLVVVAGGAGNLGQKILAHLATKPAFRVVVLDVVAPDGSCLRASEEWILCDLSSYAPSWAKLLEGAYAVFMMAARNPFPEANSADAFDSMKINANLLEACAKGGVERVVFASSNHVVGAKLHQEGALQPGCEPDFGTRYAIPGASMDSTLYASAKVAGEAMCATMVDAGRLERITVWRIGWCQPGENLPGTITITGTPTIAPEQPDGNSSSDAARILAWFRAMHLSNADLVALVDAALEGRVRRGLTHVNAVSKNAGSRWVVS